MIELPSSAAMQDYQRYIHALEQQHGWLDVDLVHNCFLMGEEVGELFKAVRTLGDRERKGGLEEEDRSACIEDIGEEIVDVFNYLLAIANRLEIDVESAFREKNAHNQTRTWGE
jgi:NTP pyrophosphatase (non-canonical NTP hydrolase)